MPATRPTPYETLEEVLDLGGGAVVVLMPFLLLAVPGVITGGVGRLRSWISHLGSTCALNVQAARNIKTSIHANCFAIGFIWEPLFFGVS